MAISMIIVGITIFIIVIAVSISNFKNVNTTTSPINTSYYEIENADEQEIKPQTKTCNYCGSELKMDENKCSSCGASVNKK